MTGQSLQILLLCMVEAEDILLPSHQTHFIAQAVQLSEVFQPMLMKWNLWQRLKDRITKQVICSKKCGVCGLFPFPEVR